MLRTYRVHVDGEDVGGVRRGRELTVEIEPGVRTVTAHIDWCGSRPLTIAAGPGERVELSVRNGLDGWRGVLVFVVVFWHRHEYLVLEHVRGGGRPPQRPVGG